MNFILREAGYVDQGLRWARKLLEICTEADLQGTLGETRLWQVLKKDIIGPNWWRMWQQLWGVVWFVKLLKDKLKYRKDVYTFARPYRLLGGLEHEFHARTFFLHTKRSWFYLCDSWSTLQDGALYSLQKDFRCITYDQVVLPRGCETTWRTEFYSLEGTWQWNIVAHNILKLMARWKLSTAP